MTIHCDGCDSTWRESGALCALLEQVGRCPDCGTEFDFDVEWFKVVCRECGWDSDEARDGSDGRYTREDATSAAAGHCSRAAACDVHNTEVVPVDGGDDA